MKSIKIVEFKDKESEYRMWKRKIMSVVISRGYCDFLLEKMVMPPQDEVLDENALNNKVELKGIKENKNAYNDLIFTCSGEIGLAIVDESVTEDLPDGDAESVWQELQRS